VFPWQFITHGITTIRKTLSQVEAEGQVLPDGTLLVYESSLITDLCLAFEHHINLSVCWVYG
jgi:hypothetical protein